MLQVSFFSRILVALILIGGILVSLPNVLPPSARAHLPAWWGNQTVSLGLDLQGGSYLLLEVQLDQVQKDKVESLKGDIRHALRKARIGYQFLDDAGDDAVSVHVLESDRVDEARTLMQGLNPSMSGGLLSIGAREYDLNEPGGNRLVLKMTDAYKKQSKEDIVTQSIEVVRKRIDEMGTREPTIERQGADRIVVQVPGLTDPGHLITILQPTAKMSFQLVVVFVVSIQATKGVVPIGSELLQRFDAKVTQQRGA